MTNTPQPKKVVVRDVALDDKKIPRNLILKYGDQYYVMKAGLEWKANQLFGGAGFSLSLEPIIQDFKNKQFVFKATLTVLANGATFVNFGEANSQNANSMLQYQLFHLAATRAECRVLRMATACGYASYDEVKTINGNGKEDQRSLEIEGGDKPATEAQLATIKALNPNEKKKPANKREAVQMIKTLAQQKGKKNGKKTT